MTKYLLLALKGLVALAFAAAGLAKLAGVDMMVATFDAIGVGQWFRYVTGIIELGSLFCCSFPAFRPSGRPCWSSQ